PDIRTEEKGPYKEKSEKEQTKEGKPKDVERKPRYTCELDLPY
ncbi:9014_t:CDS:2, partial [Acaulospora morrowiae]